MEQGEQSPRANAGENAGGNIVGEVRGDRCRKCPDEEHPLKRDIDDPAAFRVRGAKRGEDIRNRYAQALRDEGKGED
jgi:hypothetical protein